jgi:predicted enzyme related to lactoylglutathione lyase
MEIMLKRRKYNTKKFEVHRMPTITHFDISADNIERAKNFYHKLFGWKIEKSSGPIELAS